MVTSQPGNEATSQPGNEATSQPDNEATSQPGIEATSQPGNEATVQPGNVATSQPYNEATSQTGNEATSQTGNEATSQPGIEATSQPGIEAASQPGNEATARLSTLMMCVRNALPDVADVTLEQLTAMLHDVISNVTDSAWHQWLLLSTAASDDQSFLGALLHKLDDLQTTLDAAKVTHAATSLFDDIKETVLSRYEQLMQDSSVKSAKTSRESADISPENKERSAKSPYKNTEGEKSSTESTESCAERSTESSASDDSDETPPPVSDSIFSRAINKTKATVQKLTAKVNVTWHKVKDMPGAWGSKHAAGLSKKVEKFADKV